jgi:GH24 family phage-related lysozyme (muramidase)
MKNYILILIVSVSLFSCTETKVKENVNIVSTSKFTSTQQYQILCWVIKKHENYSKNSYKCQAGKSTKGWGFTNVKDVKDIHHADEIFRDIVEELYVRVNKEYPNLTYLQKAVIVSLYYNTGNINSIKKSNFSKLLVKNEIEKSINSFKSWNKVKIKVRGRKVYMISKGLTNRRTYESKLLDGSFDMADYIKLKQEVTEIYKNNRS